MVDTFNNLEEDERKKVAEKINTTFAQELQPETYTSYALSFFRSAPAVKLVANRAKEFIGDTMQAANTLTTGCRII